MEDRQRFEEDDDEVEQRRREYLRRHREMLLQKQRLETVRLWSFISSQIAGVECDGRALMRICSKGYLACATSS